MGDPVALLQCNGTDLCNKAHVEAPYINRFITIKNAKHFQITPIEKIDNAPLIKKFTIEISTTSPNSLSSPEHGKRKDTNTNKNNITKVKGYIFQLFAPTANIKQAKQATKK